MRSLDRNAKVVGKNFGRTAMIDMAVGEEKLLDRHALGRSRRLQSVQVASRVGEGALHGLSTPDQAAILLQRGDRDDHGLERGRRHGAADGGGRPWMQALPAAAIVGAMTVLFDRREILAGTGALAAFPAAAGHRANDVPFVATPHALVERMLDLAAISPGDYLIDLGCGDGRIAVAAAKRGARSLGVDIDRLRIEEATAAARIAGVERRARFRNQDLFRTPIFDATVIALYLLPEVNLALRPRLLTELKPGARIVSHAFDMGDWRPDSEEKHDLRRIFLWIVPAVAGGDWALTDGSGRQAFLRIQQRFQSVEGTLEDGDRTWRLRDTALRGTRLDFAVDTEAGPKSYRGIVEGNLIRPAPEQAVDGTGWQARRIG